MTGWSVRRLGRVLAIGLPLALAVSMLGQQPVLARTSKSFTPLKPQQERSVAGVDAPGPKARPADPAAAPALHAPPAVTWPAAGSTVVDLGSVTDPRITARGPAQAAGLPVRLDRPRVATSAAVPATARVDVLDHDTAVKADRALLVRVGRTDGGTGPATVKVSLDYSGFRGAFGADWATRLRLVQLPECALTTPQAPECQPAPLASVNDAAGQTVSADVALPGSAPATAKGAHPDAATAGPAMTMLAATSGPSGAAGDFTATPLAPSATWQAGGSSGDFSWSYPMRVPPSLDGPKPDVTLAYSAQSVDGHSAASNNQPSWAGEGFAFWPGSITRGYKACADDMGGNANNTTKTGDECWGSYNATLSMAGHAGELIRDDATGTWKLKGDDGSRVELLTGASNGDDNGEYWKVTTTDGTQYFFGLNRLTGWASGKPETNSAWTVPVFGNNTGEPCRQTSFASSWCMQAWQWNLDYVVDTHGDTMSMWYATETNHYARNLTSSTVSTYTRGGTLTRIDYGTDNRSGTDTEYTSGSAPMRVAFTTADRCIPNTTCDFSHADSWPDLPLDQNCSSTTSCTQASPTFWTQKRLASVKTQVWGGTAYRDVEQWTLNHTYPNPGDSTRAGLWLAGVSHTGLVGGTASVPDVTFTGVQMANRVDTVTDQSPPMNWWRISYITSESGGIIGVTYSPGECVAGSNMPAAADSNAKRCFPVYWTRPGQQNPTIDWFHKYVVAQVTETDPFGASPRAIHTYTYPNPPAWHYDSDDGLVPAARKTWAQWRGYDRVEVTTGDPGEQAYTVTRFFRGMNGDHLSSGGSRSVSVDGIADEDAFAGMTRESVTYNGPGGAEVSGTANTPWQSTAQASRTVAGVTVTARHSGIQVAANRTALDGGRGNRTSTVTTTFDNTFGYSTQEADGGDDAIVGTDDRCTVHTRLNNTGAWIIGVEARTEVYAKPCGTAPASEADVISDTKNSFDHQAYGAAPTKGELTQVDTAKSWTSPTSIAYVTTDKKNFDAYGRVVDAWDMRGNHTGTAYTPASGGPVTRTTSTSPLGWTTSSDFEPAWGSILGTTDVNGRRTDVAYDPLGRLTALWKPGRAKATQTANTTYAYTLSNTGPSSLATNQLNPGGNYVTSYQLFDGLLRKRQTQAPAAVSGTGRVITDTVYDTAGRVVKENGLFFNNAANPGTTLFLAQDNQVPNQTVTAFDGAGRTTASILKSNGVEKWRTTTAYGGDRTDTTPPAGGTATSTVTDVRGQTVAMRQYQSGVPSGAYDTTSYGFDRKGQRTSLTDSAGNAWTWTYDLRGHVVQTTDPDKGTVTSTVNDAGDVLTTTDSRGKVVAFGYDAIGRKTGRFDTSTSGTQLAGWTYDNTLMSDGVTTAKDHLSTSTRYVGGNAYTTTVRGYTDGYQVTGQTFTIPAAEGALAGSYAFTNTYAADGSPLSVRMPAAGGLSAETLTTGFDATTGLATTLRSNYAATPTYVTDTQYTAYGEPSVTSFSTGGRMAQAGLYYDEATRQVNETVTVKETAPSVVGDAHYSYDPAGNVTKIADTPAGGTADTQCFTSDYLRRLTAAWTPGNGDCTAAPTAAGLGGPAKYWLSWTFDVSGSRQTQTDKTNGTDLTTTYTYPAAGAAHPHELNTTSGATAGSYTYDNAGDTIGRPGPHGQQTLGWDVEGHLATLTDTAGANSYVYDDEGNRLVARDPAGTTLFLPGMELRLAGGTVTATRYYTYAGKTIAQRTATGVRWLSGDLHKTQLIAIDQSTQSVSQRRQTPYGAARGTAPAWVNPHGFVDGTDDPTGLTHLGAREYDSATGRFVSVDPEMDPKDPQSLQGYLYANNSPFTFSDANGRGWGTFWKVAAIVAVVVVVVAVVVIAGPAIVAAAPAILGAAAEAGATTLAATGSMGAAGVAAAGAAAAEVAVAGGSAIAGAAGVGLAAVGLAGRMWFRGDADEPIGAGMPMGPRPAGKQPKGGNGKVLRDGDGATDDELAASSAIDGTNRRPVDPDTRQRMLDRDRDDDGRWTCWRCGHRFDDPDDIQAGHRNKARSNGGNLSDTNICAEGWACNSSAQNRGGPSPGMSCAERYACGNIPPSRMRFRNMEDW